MWKFHDIFEKCSPNLQDWIIFASDLHSLPQSYAQNYSALISAHARTLKELADSQKEGIKFRADLKSSATELAECQQAATLSQSRLACSLHDLSHSQQEATQCRTLLESGSTELLKCRSDLNTAHTQVACSFNKLAHSQREVIRLRSKLASSAVESTSHQKEISRLRTQLATCAQSQVDARRNMAALQHSLAEIGFYKILLGQLAALPLLGSNVGCNKFCAPGCAGK